MRALLYSVMAVSVAHAQYIVNSGSFGHDKTLSPNKYAIPGWDISGEGQVPELLSDKVILTPPYPGNRRGAIWQNNRVLQSEWTADFEFRATGPERGGGNLQIWYAQEGQIKIGTSSIYTVGQFDGLVLVIDMYGGRGGGIRGFLNDGKTDYKNHHNVDSLAFGHCDYSYRNLGRPSHIQITNIGSSFAVTVDQKECFRSDKISLPAGYHFGISAASAETPDSFEVFKFVLTTASSVTREEPQRKPPPPQEAPSDQQQQGNNAPAQNTPPSSSSITPQEFSQLQNRVDSMSQSVENIFSQLVKLAESSENRHLELVPKVDRLGGMDQRLSSLESTLAAIKKEVESQDYQGHFARLQESLKDTHSSLLEGLPQSMSQIVSTSAPRMGLILFALVGVQLLLAGAYIVYKRRRASGPKKYL